MKLNTSTLGFGLCALGVLLLITYLITGRGDAAQVFLIAGGMVTAGVAAIRSADANEAVMKHELPNYGAAGKNLSDGVIHSEQQQAAEEKAEEKKKNESPTH